MELTLATFLSVAVAFGLAGFVKGVIGLGLPTVSIGLLGLVMPPAAAAAILIAPSIVTNFQQLQPWSRVPALARRLWPMIAGIAVGVAFTGGTLTGGDARTASGALGIALLAYAAFGLSNWRPRLDRRHEVWAGPLTGVATGAVTGATGVFVLPLVPYLQALGFEKDDLVQALGLTFFVATLALAGDLMRGGAMTPQLVVGSLFALAPAVGGMWLGRRARGTLSAEAFRRWFFVGLAGIGGALALRAFG